MYGHSYLIAPNLGDVTISHVRGQLVSSQIRSGLGEAQNEQKKSDANDIMSLKATHDLGNILLTDWCARFEQFPQFILSVFFDGHARHIQYVCAQSNTLVFAVHYATIVCASVQSCSYQMCKGELSKFYW